MTAHKREIESNLKLLADYMADQLVRLHEQDSRISAEKLRDITNRIYRFANEQARVGAARVQSMIAFTFPTTVFLVVGFVSGALYGDTSAPIAALLLWPLLTALSSRLYVWRLKSSSSWLESFFAPGEWLGRQVARPIESRLMQIFWTSLSRELKARGKTFATAEIASMLELSETKTNYL